MTHRHRDSLSPTLRTHHQTGLYLRRGPNRDIVSMDGVSVRRGRGRGVWAVVVMAVVAWWSGVGGWIVE